MTFSNQQKKFMKNSIVLKRQLQKLPLQKLLAKFLTEKNYLINNFTFARLKFL